MLTYFQAVVLGLLQGVTELFPVSSLGHSVILPQLLGWTGVVAAQSASESYFLALLVGLHVATALGARDLLPRHLGPDHPGRPGLARDAADRDARSAPGLAPDRRHDPGRDGRPAPGASAAGRVREAARSRRVPRDQRPDPAGRRVGPTAGPVPGRRTDAPCDPGRQSRDPGRPASRRSRVPASRRRSA